VTDSVPVRGWREFGAHMGEAYLRYSFTKSTSHEVDVMIELMSLRPGAIILDVGCGPGRHSHELARRGMTVHGVDLSERFVDVASAAAPIGATFEVLDATGLGQHSRLHDRFDAAISWCQGAFGSLPASPFGHAGGAAQDLQVLAGIRACLRPGGQLALGSFSALFQARHLEESDDYTALTGHNLELTELCDTHGSVVAAELETTCFTPREVALLLERAGFVVDCCWSHTPGRRGLRPVSVDEPEFVTLAHRVD